MGLYPGRWPTSRGALASRWRVGAAREVELIIRRGEVWLADLDPTRGHEQAGTRPVLVLSADPLNQGPATLVIVLPITSRRRSIASHVDIEPPEGGLRVPSVALCEAIRSISKSRLIHSCGAVRPLTMHRVEDVVRLLLKL